MREIKFRVWDQKYKDMYDVTDLTNFHHGVTLKGRKGDSGGEYWVTGGYIGKKIGIGPNGTGKQINRFELMQYTGLKDKNGKEIYEGDIVKGIAFDGYNVSNGVIKFPDCSYTVEFKDKNARGFYYLHHIRLETIEVIGNIYENPELVKS